MPPVSPHSGVLEKDRLRLNLPKDICPLWFKDETEVIFVPLHWYESIPLSDIRRVEALLICSASHIEQAVDWYISPVEVINKEKNKIKPEEQRLLSLIYNSKLNEHSGGIRLNCPPIIKRLCDPERRVYLTDHSLGVCVFSPNAFNELYSNIKI